MLINFSPEISQPHRSSTSLNHEISQLRSFSMSLNREILQPGSMRYFHAGKERRDFPCMSVISRGPPSSEPLAAHHPT